MAEEAPKSRRRLWIGIIICAILLLGICSFTLYIVISTRMSAASMVAFVPFMLVWGFMMLGVPVWDRLCQLRGVRRPFQPPYRVKMSATVEPDLYHSEPPYVLKPETRGYAAIAFSVIVALLSSFIGLIMLLLLITDFGNEDRTFYFLSMLLSGTIAIATFISTFKNYLKHKFANRTRFSISTIPVPGSNLDVTVSHPDFQGIEQLAVDLIMEERTGNSEGYNYSEFQAYAVDVPVFRIFGNSMRPNLKTCQTRVCLPVTTMPSFKTKHNELRWFLLVRIDLKSWNGRLKQKFPMPVVAANIAHQFTRKQSGLGD